MSYSPPLTITARLIDLVSRISESLGRWEGADIAISPKLRRQNRIRSIEFIHPFSDGNGRMGRLWQTLILSHWKPRLGFLPIETVVHAQQAGYYKAMVAADQIADASPFAEFILGALLETVETSITSDPVIDPVIDPVSDPVSDPVVRLVGIFKPDDELSIQTMMERLQLRHRTYFRRTFLTPTLAAGRLVMTQPDSPRSPTQRYRLTPPPSSLEARNQNAHHG